MSPFSGGFTLIELLVVLLIIGVMIGVAVIGGGEDATRVAEDEARRLAALLEVTEEQAVLEGMTYGLGVGRDGYRFFRLHDGDWQLLEDDRVLRPRRLHEELRLSLTTESRHLALADTERVVRPQVVVHASGERTAFALEVGPGNAPAVYRVEGGSFGALELTALGQGTHAW